MEATLDLTSETTHEEIQTYVNHVLNDVAEDRAGDEAEPSDAQRIAAERDKPDGDQTADGKSGSDDDTAKPAKGGDDAGKKDPGQDWLDENLKAEVAAYGIAETELADFTSREELERALRIFDRTALDAGRKALAEGEAAAKKPEVEEATGRARGEAGKFLPKESKDGRYEIGLDRELFDENLIGELEKIRDHYDSRLEALEKRLHAADATAEEQRFDGFVDSLGHAKLFGKTGSETPEQLKRREDLLVAVKAQQIGLERLGRQVDLDESLVRRVARMAFPDELAREELKSRTRRMQQQSSKRMGGGATRAHNDAEPLRDEMRRLYKELETA